MHKRMPIFVATTAIIASMALPASSQSRGVPIQALEQAARYAASISCYRSDAEVEADNDLILPVVLEEGVFDEGLTTGRYLIMQAVDVGCAGGAGTTFAIPIVVEKEFGTSAIYVVPHLTSYQGLEDVNLRSVIAVTSLGGGRVEFVWRDYAEGDANAAPSLILQGVFKLDEDGIWLPS